MYNIIHGSQVRPNRSTNPIVLYRGQVGNRVGSKSDDQSEVVYM